MTDPGTVAVAVATLGVAVFVGMLQRPRPPDLDAERWFKAMLSTLLRGVDAPRAELDPVDPGELGPAYDPARVLGPAGSWEALAAWGAGQADAGAVLRQRGQLRWGLVPSAERQGPDLLGALAEALGEIGAVVPVPAGRLDEAAEALGETLAALAPAASDRLVLVAEAEGAHLLLRALVDRPVLRDRVVAVVSVGGVLRGWTDRGGPLAEDAVVSWMDAHFDTEQLDTEAIRQTPYLALQWRAPGVLPPGQPGLPLEHARFPAPRDPMATGTLVPMDLGALPAVPELPLPQVARALWAVVTCLVLLRR